jgi:hypothetical protein
MRWIDAVEPNESGRLDDALAQVGTRLRLDDF